MRWPNLPPPRRSKENSKSETGSAALFVDGDGNVAGVLSRRNRGEHTISLGGATHFSE